MSDADASPVAATPAIPPRQFLALLGLAAVIGLVVSLAAFGFLELVHYIPQWVYEDLPDAVGYDDGAPLWWYLPVCAFAGLVVAFAIVRLPGRGGHVPAYGLNAGPTEPGTCPASCWRLLRRSGWAWCWAPRRRYWRSEQGSRSSR